MKLDAFIYYLILIVVFAAIFGKFIFLPFNEGLWWDEAVYLGLGKSLTGWGYSLDPVNVVESYRPPAFSFFISYLSFSVFLVRIFVVLVSILAVFSLYYLTKLLFDKKTALWSSLFMSTNFLFVFFTSKALTESLFILFFTLSIIFFIKWQNNKKKLYLMSSAIISSLAFLTRYLGIILIISYIIYFLYLILKENRKSNIKNLVLFLVPFFIILIPWFLLNLIYFNGIFSGFEMNFKIYASTLSTDFLSSVLDFSYLLIVVNIFMVIGFFFAFRNYRKMQGSYLILLISVFSIILFFVLPHKEIRYLLSFLPVYSIISAFGLVKILDAVKGRGKNLISFGVIFVILLILISGLHAISIDNNASKALVQASEKIKQITEPHEIILSASFPYGYTVAGRRTIDFCGIPEPSEEYFICQKDIRQNNWDIQKTFSFMNQFNVTYILLYKFEPENPANAKDFFDKNLEKVESFEQYGDKEAAVIYRLKP